MDQQNNPDNTGDSHRIQGKSEIQNSDKGDAVSGQSLITATLESFDPSIHVSGDDGQPVVTVSGTLRKKPGRKPGRIDTSGPAETAAGATLAPAKRAKTKLDVEANRAAALALSTQLLKVAVGALKFSIGEEWEFQDQAEADSLKGALATYIEAKGDRAFTPETMLLLVAAGYVMPRFAVPNTRAKVGGLFAKIGGWAKSGFRAIFPD